MTDPLYLCTVSERVGELSFAHMTRNVKTYTELNMYKIKDTENYLALWGSEVSVTPGCTSEHTSKTAFCENWLLNIFTAKVAVMRHRK